MDRFQEPEWTNEPEFEETISQEEWNELKRLAEAERLIHQACNLLSYKTDANVLEGFDVAREDMIYQVFGGERHDAALEFYGDFYKAEYQKALRSQMKVAAE